MAVDETEISWPLDWQPQAIDAVRPFLNGSDRLHIVVGDPANSLSGSVVGGHVFIKEGIPMIIYDKSEKPDVYPWRLPRGPVLRIELLRPRRPRQMLFAQHGWEGMKPKASVANQPPLE